MLVLSRQKQESIRISDNITITVLEIRGNRVAIGIDAPDDYRIVRTELLGRFRPEETKGEHCA
jgi:carbon storage regulator